MVHWSVENPTRTGLGKTEGSQPYGTVRYGTSSPKCRRHSLPRGGGSYNCQPGNETKRNETKCNVLSRLSHFRLCLNLLRSCLAVFRLVSASSSVRCIEFVDGVSASQRDNRRGGVFLRLLYLQVRKPCDLGHVGISWLEGDGETGTYAARGLALSHYLTLT